MLLKAWPTYPTLVAIVPDKGKVEARVSPDSTGNVNWAEVHMCIDERQGKYNLYSTVNATRASKDSKANQIDI